MASTSASERLARELLEYCLSGREWPANLLDRLLAQPDTKPLFAIVVERLADLFEPHLCDVYAKLFSQIIERVRPVMRSEDLVERYERVRRVRAVNGDARNVFVLSRVTLGADVAVTSVVLDAAKKRFPEATVHFAGARKNYELFAADARIRHCNFQYNRDGSLADRLASWPTFENGIVIDPDSRLTQLGLLPVCDERSYYFFESRSYGAETSYTLSSLTRRWCAEVLGVADAHPYIAPAVQGGAYDVTVSFGVGENQEKRVGGRFEAELLQALRGRRIIVDTGADHVERARVERAVQAAGGDISTWSGDYATFAATIARSKLYIGYDSAGQHVAAACGVPLISVFRGEPSERFVQRWMPAGWTVIRAQGLSEQQALTATLRAMTTLRLT